MVGLMLFSLFFGAGNLIFPPMLGKMAGTSMYLSMMFFGVTAIILPILGVVAVAKSDGLNHMGRKVSNWFATLFTIVIYLSMGPLMGIPRAGTVPYEIGLSPSVPEEWNTLALFLFTCLFFAVTYWLSLNPSKIAERVGKYLSPILLLLMITLFVCSFFNPMGDYLPPVGKYKENPFTSGFLEGYMTMDAVGALNFGLVIAMVIHSFQITNKREVMRATIKTGVLAGGLLLFIYLMLAHLGATSAALFPETTNGAQLLNLASNHIFGKFGAYLVAGIFTLACLTTCVGLISSSAQYFASWTKRLGYKGWVTLWTLCSIFIANIGLDLILTYSVPILSVIYPVAIVLILLTLADSLFQGRTIVYKVTVYTTAVISLLFALNEVGLALPFVTQAAQKLPFSTMQLGWVLPALLAFGISILFCFIQKGSKKKSFSPCHTEKLKTTGASKKDNH